MLRIVMGLFMLASVIPPCWADDLTDAITGVDPRNHLTSGTGAALDNLYGPKEPEETAPTEELSENSTLPSYGLSSKDLLDPMGTDKEKEKDSLLPENAPQLNDQGTDSAGEESASYPLY